jgi:hypothetical protein
MKEITVELTKLDLHLTALQENIWNVNCWIDKKEYNLLCGAETETGGRNVSTFVVLKMLGLVQWDLDIYVKILIVRINECLYS